MADNVTITPAGSKMVFTSGSTDLLTLSGNVSGSDASLGYLTLSNNAAASSTGLWIVNNNAIGVGGNQFATLALSSADSSMIKFYKGSGSDGTTAQDNFTIDSSGDGSKASFEWRGSGKMTLLSGGKVGIGTSAPAYDLDIHSTYPRIGLTDTNGITYYIQNQSNHLYLYDATNTTTRLFIKDGGDIGIGTVEPATKLTVEGALTLKEQAAADGDTAAYGQVWVKSGTPNTLYFTDDAGTDVQLGAGGGTFGGSLSDNYIPIGTAADTIGNFVLGLHDASDYSLYIGSDPASTTDEAQYNTAVGINTLEDIVRGDHNTAFGYNSLKNITDGTGNTAVGGYNTLGAATTAIYNTAIGHSAGHSITDARYNDYIGYSAGYSNVVGDYNVAIGYKALEDHAPANGVGHTVAIGSQAGAKTTTAGYNTFVGFQSGYTNTTGEEVTYIGYKAGYTNNSNYTVAIGNGALEMATGVGSSVAIGRQAMGAAAATGDDNVAIGYRSMYDLTTGLENVAVGHFSLPNVTSGSSNVAIGRNSMNASAGSHRNTALGHSVLQAFTAAGESKNTAVGMNSMYAITAGTFNTAVGYESMRGNSGVTPTGNCVLGYQALRGVTTADSTANFNNVAIGMRALYSASGADNNVAIGFAAMSGASDATGDSNVAIGSYAGNVLTSAAEGVMMGVWAGSSITTGHYNTLLGYAAGGKLTTSTKNVAVGHGALYGHATQATTSTGNVAIGMGAMNLTSGANNNTAIGMGALSGAAAGMQGDSNVAIGLSALGNATDPYDTVAIGNYAGYDVTTAFQNTLVGYYAGGNIVTGSNNTVMGNSAMRTLVSGRRNTAVGESVLYDALGSYNVAMGYYAGFDLTSGEDNVIVGYRAGYAGGTMMGCVYVGREAGFTNTGNYCTFIGQGAGYYADGMDESTIIGQRAGWAIQGDENVAVGTYALSGHATQDTESEANVAIGFAAMMVASGAASNTAVGQGALSGSAAGMTGDQNVAVGRQSLHNATSADDNVVVGYQAGYTTTSGKQNTFIGKETGKSNTVGDYNIAVGQAALFTNVHGDNNTAIGHQALYTTAPADGAGKNVAIGHAAGFNNTTGTGNVFIGYEAGANTGHDTESDKLVIANSNTTSPLITGSFGDGTIQFNVSGNKPDSFIIKGDQTAGEDGLTIDNWEPRIQLKNRRDTDETWKINAPNDSSSLQFRKDSHLIAAIFPADDGGGVTFGIAAAAALPGVAIASGASLSFDNTSANRIYRTGGSLAFSSTESFTFNNNIDITSSKMIAASTVDVAQVKDDTGFIMQDTMGIRNNVYTISEWMADLAGTTLEGNLQAFSKVQVIKTDTIDPGQLGAATGLKLYLPAAVTGMEYIVTFGTEQSNLSGKAFSVDANGSELIYKGGTEGAVAFSKNTGESLHVSCFETGKWSVVAHT